MRKKKSEIDADDGQYDVGLVTFYFVNNYGAIITAFSLYDYLDRKGYKTVMVAKPSFWWGDFDSEKRPLSVSFYENHAEFTKVYDRENIDELDDLCKSFVVGSDQLWNQKLYANAGYYTLLGFSKKSKRISYSTSFGKDNFTDSPKYVEEAKNCLRRFDGISLRENTGVELCKNVFGVDSVWNLDAVFLTPKERYLELASEVVVEKPERYVFAYVLDPNPYKDKLIKEISEKMGIDYILVTDGGAVVSGKEISTGLKVTDADTVQSWLSYIADADFIITDSFHGTCFSIIFEKQFLSVKNRGITRMESLTNLFGLENYILPSKFEITPEFLDLYTKPIDWNRVNVRKAQLIKQSSEWLESQIKGRKVKERSFVESRSPVITNVTKLGLNYPTSIQMLAVRMPRNSILILPVDKKEETVTDVPKSFGILTLKKTTDHYVYVEFS
ncbi:MAG: polysaccharide pyruvyl transferase family protein, partial [Spirochaetales bacterium]|nr:polysaccharide pyruvyl transferase family protein [Spirochaetales bacterium]